MRAMRVAGLHWLLAVAYASAASAQGIADPTKPPPGWLPGASAPAARAEQKAEGSGSEPVQLVLVGKTRRYALVNGELVGEKTAGSKLVDIRRNELVVQTEKGQETLNLFPDVQKTPPKKRAGMGKKE